MKLEIIQKQRGHTSCQEPVLIPFN